MTATKKAAKKRAKVKPQERSATTRHLAVKLTDAELIELGKESGELAATVKKLESEKKDYVDQMKNRVAGAQGRIDDIAAMQRTGEQVRLVDCEWRFGMPDKKHKSLVRLDTDEVEEVAEMSEADLQTWLGGDRSLARPKEGSSEGGAKATKKITKKAAKKATAKQ